jgi:post-segregation antitoxin (ccd killing protein)
MRMARVNISLPDGIHRMAKEADLNISKLARDAILQELDRLAKIAAVDEYLAELEAEHGPIPEDEQARAAEFVKKVYGSSEGRQTA